MKNLKDPKFQILWEKRGHVHAAQDGTKTRVHWMQQKYTDRVAQMKIKNIRPGR